MSLKNWYLNLTLKILLLVLVNFSFNNIAHAGPDEDASYMGELAATRAAGHSAKTLIDLFLTAKRTDAFNAVSLLQANQDLLKYRDPIEQIVPNYFAIENLYESEDIILAVKASNADRFRKIQLIRDQIDNLGFALDVIGLARDSYELAINASTAFDFSNKNSIQLKAGLNASLNLKSAYDSTLSIATLLKGRVGANKAFRFWVNNPFAQGYTKVLGPKTLAGGPLSLLQSGAEVQSYAYTYFRDRNINTIKDNAWEVASSTVRSRQTFFTLLIDSYLAADRFGAEMTISQISNLFKGYSVLNGFHGQLTAGQQFVLFRIFEQIAGNSNYLIGQFGKSSFDQLTNQERVFIGIRAISEMAAYEDNELEGYLTDILVGNPTLADIVFGAIRDDIYDIYQTDALFEKFFPYSVTSESAVAYYEGLYRTVFNGEVASFILGKLATLGESELELSADDSTGCEFTNTCTVLPIVDGLVASTVFLNKVEVEWTGVSGANYYSVYRCTDQFELSTCAYLVGAELAAIDDVAAETGRDYFYRVEACNDFACSSALSSATKGAKAVLSDSMVHISDSIKDGTIIGEGVTFTQEWTVKNNGGTTWNSNYCLKFHDGIGMGLLSTRCVVGLVAPDMQYTFSAPMIAPSATSVDSTYRDNWRLYKNSTPISGNIWVEILVEGVEPVGDTPSVFTASSQSPTSIELSWASDSSGTDYRLYRSDSLNGEYIFARQLSSLSYIDDSLSPSTTYFYKLQRCASGSTDSCSAFSTAKSATTFASAMPNSLLSNLVVSGSGVTGSVLSMAVSAANGGGIAKNDRFKFVFARSSDVELGAGDDIILEVAETGNFTLPVGESEDYGSIYQIPDDSSLGSTNILACMLYEDLSENNQQYCLSSAVTIVDEPVQVPSTPNKPSLNYQQGQDEVGVAWNNSSGGSFYRVERSINPSGGFAEIYSGSGFSYIDGSINDETTYYYRLKSCQNSLAVTCSRASSNTVLSTLATATNDFSAQSLKLSRSGNQISIEAGQAYSGTSTALVRPNMGFFLSSDNVCTSQDIFLGAQSSGLNINDVVDVESITATYPSQANSGTWYACAIADYDNRFGESNENNNAVFSVAQNDVAPPVPEPLTINSGGQIRVTWAAVPGNVSYRLQRSTSSDGPFELAYSGTDLTHRDDNLLSCTSYFYKLESCDGAGANPFCISSPVIATASLPNVSPAPTLTAHGENKIEINWSGSNCANYYTLNRRRLSSSGNDRVYNGGGTQHTDINIFPNTTYTYSIDYCRSEEGFFNNGCATRSAEVSVTTPASNLPDLNWKSQASDPSLSGRTGATQIVFQNRLWVVGGRVSNIQQNDVWASEDGVSWTQVTASAPFTAREFINLGVLDNKLIAIGGRLSDGSRSKEIWSTLDGDNWVLETANAPFPSRASNAVTISFNGKLWLIGGSKISDSTNSFDGHLADIWSSTDGQTWTQVTSNAPFGVQGNHQIVEADGKLLLYSGEATKQAANGFQTHIYNDSIWSSVDGSTWELEKENLPYGPRDQFSVIEFDHRYWLIGGRQRVQTNSSRDNANDQFIPSLSYLSNDDVWVSSDGLTWSIVDKATSIPSLSARNAINFNNHIWVGENVGSTRWYTNYGQALEQPEGLVVIQGLPSNRATIEVDLSKILLNFEQSGLSYQWIKNGIPITGAMNPSLLLSSVEVGDQIAVKVRYTNDSEELFEFFSASVTVTVNTISSEFVIDPVITSVGSVWLTNSLDNWLNNYSVSYTSDNENIATVAGAQDVVTINPVGVGSAGVIAEITDSVSGATKQVSFDVTVDRGAQQLAFSVGHISKAIGSPEFLVFLSETGSSSEPIIFSSSNPAVASVTANGSSVAILVNNIGDAVITASRAGDSNYNQSSAMLTLSVFDGDSDSDGVLDDVDNCLSTPNPNQLNIDGDAYGDVCDPDVDGDFVIDEGDCAPVDVERWLNRNGYNDSDLDGIGAGLSVSVCSGQFVPEPFVERGDDNCASTPNAGQDNFDGDLQGDACDADDDNDLIDDILDCADRDDSRWRLLDGYLDIDEDGVGYGIIDQVCSGNVLPADYALRTDDNCQFDSNPSQANSDADILGNACDDDDDNDDVLDDQDNCPLIANTDQTDENGFQDGSGEGDACEDQGELCIPVKALNNSVVLICL